MREVLKPKLSQDSLCLTVLVLQVITTGDLWNKNFIEIMSLSEIIFHANETYIY